MNTPSHIGLIPHDCVSSSCGRKRSSLLVRIWNELLLSIEYVFLNKHCRLIWAAKHRGMAFGLDDSDLEDLIESSTSEDDAAALPIGVSAPQSIPSLRVLTATARREPLQGLKGDACRAVPPNRQAFEILGLNCKDHAR